MIRRALILLATMTALPAVAGEVVFESKAARTHLIELYTSEGCSSCLPAEEWMSGLKNQPRLWQDIVPLAFHVDYWDHLGWKDSFASKIWTERQADYSVRWKGESVYTPAFALDGKEWHYGKLPAPATEAQGVLKIIVNGDKVTATFKASNGEGRYDIHVARLGFALGMDITAGENSGRKLMHDFVVLGLTNETMKAGAKELQLPAPSKTSTGEARTAIAAWVTQVGQIEPIQAVGGWLP
ncbi:MAG: DUF1223 domain-containing protein [Verrucomicrobiota bacterium]|nr:DUF1223 domain-containing protein [Verrucomicrobiota bacterium]